MSNEEPQGRSKATVEVNDWRLQKVEETQDKILLGQERLHEEMQDLKATVMEQHASLPCNVREIQTKTLVKEVAEIDERVTALENSKINWKNVAIFAGTLATALGLDKLAEAIGILNPKP